MRLERMYVDKIIKLTVPMHEELKRGTLRQIIADAELSVDEFVNLLR